MTPTDLTDLDPIRKRLEAAEPHLDPVRVQVIHKHHGWDLVEIPTDPTGGPPIRDFVRHAPADTAALLAEVERLRVDVQVATGETQRFATATAIVREHGATEAADLREELGAVRERFCVETRRLERERDEARGVIAAKTAHRDAAISALGGTDEEGLVPTAERVRRERDEALAEAARLRAQVEALAAAREEVALLVPVGEATGTVEQNVAWYIARLRAALDSALLEERARIVAYLRSRAPAQCVCCCEHTEQYADAIEAGERLEPRT